jgi:hypothetical protein
LEKKMLSVIESSFFADGMRDQFEQLGFWIKWPPKTRGLERMNTEQTSGHICPLSSNHSHFKTETKSRNTLNLAFQADVLPSQLSVTASAWIIFIWVVFFWPRARPLSLCVCKVPCLLPGL